MTHAKTSSKAVILLLIVFMCSISQRNKFQCRSPEDNYHSRWTEKYTYEVIAMDTSVVQTCIFFMFVYYILIIIVYGCCSKIFRRRDPETSDEFQLDNVGNLTRINSDLQRCLVLEQSHQQSNAPQHFRINLPILQSTVVPLSSDLNYLGLNAFDVTSSSRPLMDDLPPSYEESTMMSSSSYY